MIHYDETEPVSRGAFIIVYRNRENIYVCRRAYSVYIRIYILYISVYVGARAIKPPATVIFSSKY